MPIERFNGSKLGLTHDESRPESGTHETLPDSAIRPETETPFDRANKAAAEKRMNGMIPLEEAVDPTVLDTSLIDETKELAAKLNARYEAAHPPVQTADAHEEQTKIIDANPTIPAGYHEPQEKPEEQKYAKSVTTEHPLPIGSTAVEETAKKITNDLAEAEIHKFHATPEAEEPITPPVVKADSDRHGTDMKYDYETKQWIPASEGVTYTLTPPKEDIIARDPEDVDRFIAASMEPKVPEGYENAKDLSTTATPIAVKAEDMMQEISDGEPTTYTPAEKEEEPEPSLDSIRPTDAASTIVLIAALMEILASQVKNDDDLPTMEELHFTRENLQVILGNPQIGKSFFEVFKDMLLASDYADLAFDFMFEGPEFDGMDKQSLIAGAKFAYSHMA